MSFRALKEFLPRFTQKPPIKKGLRQVLIFKLAKELIADFLDLKEEVFRDEVSFRLRKGMLFIFSQNSYFCQELSFYKEELKEKINQKIKEDKPIKQVLIRKI